MQDLGLNIDLAAAGIVQRQEAPRHAGIIKATDGVIPLFFKMPIFDKRASEAAEEAIYRQVDYVEIVVPGQRDKWIGPVNDRHRERFPEQWESYKRGEVQIEEGTPILNWTAIPPQRAQELRALRVYTVEILADLPDGAASRIGPDFRALQKMARRYLEEKDKAESLGATVEQQAAQLAELLARQAELQAEVARLQAADAAAQGKTRDQARTDATVGGATEGEALAAELERMNEGDPADAVDAGTLPRGGAPRRR